MKMFIFSEFMKVFKFGDSVGIMQIPDFPMKLPDTDCRSHLELRACICDYLCLHLRPLIDLIEEVNVIRYRCC